MDSRGVRKGKAAKGSVNIGTSGWYYTHWKGPFYPRDIKNEDMLSFYAQRLRTVEINNSFYNLPSKKTLENWRAQVPADFIFAVKASRYITHMKKLREPRKTTAKFFDRITVLGDKLGPVLFQLPPRWKFNRERLEVFLKSLSAEFRYAMEFRDSTWFTKAAYDLLARYGVAFCIYELAGLLSSREVTGDFVYVRLHGPARTKYEGKYSARDLSGWAGSISTWRRQGKDVFFYFDNDEAGYAAQNATSLLAILENR
jgi:uncharacterized protein YecE (DUF72 family)